MSDSTGSDIREKVSQRYGEIAESGGSCCCGSGEQKSKDVMTHAKAIGYDEADIAALPEGANLGLGCGSPTSLTLIKEGWTVVDMGSGAGVDCFIASKKVGASGQVIGVDMTDQMLEKARQFADEHGYTNVEFRKGVIEQLPLDCGSIDLIISNCVINLSPDKSKVFQEIARVLKPGGKAAVSDIVLLKELPGTITEDLEAYIGCIAGAEMINDYLAHAISAGLNIEAANRKEYDVVKVLGCSPEAGRLIEKLPDDFDGNAHVASLDLVVTKPGECCSSDSEKSSGGCCCEDGNSYGKCC